MSSESIKTQISDQLEQVDLSNRSTIKFDPLKSSVQQLLDLGTNEEVYCSTIGKSMGNINARMQQMRAPQQRERTTLFVGVINNLDNLIESQVPISQTKMALSDPGLPNFKGSLWLDRVHGKWVIARATVRSSESSLIEKLNDSYPGIHIDALNVPKPGGQVSSAQIIHKSDSSILERLLNYRNVILEGPAGVGKSFEISLLKQSFDATKIMVFHPSSNYEDFMEGLRPTATGFEAVDGVFLAFCKAAAEAGSQDPEAKFLFVIDEINRANTSKIFGDLLYSLESSKRIECTLANQILSSTIDLNGSAEGLWIELQNTRYENGLAYRQRFVVPDNVYVLATANTTDRSVGYLDLALRRRFSPIRMRPLPPDELAAILHRADLEVELYEWALLNERIAATIGLDAQLGHSYFFDFVNSLNGNGGQIWPELLLPQLAEIATAFNAHTKLEFLLDGMETGGFTLKIYGSGMDSFPVVEAKSNQ
jgi:hypothetical protein